jgi:hypothetical protein
MPDLGRELDIPFVTCGSYPTRSGNLARPLIDGVPAFRRIGEAIAGARHSVWLSGASVRGQHRALSAQARLPA